jgi:hypothetical protein
MIRRGCRTTRRAWQSQPVSGSRYRGPPDRQLEAGKPECEIRDGGEGERALAAERLCVIELEVLQHRDRAVSMLNSSLSFRREPREQSRINFLKRFLKEFSTERQRIPICGHYRRF